MSVALVTGSGGLAGAQAARSFGKRSRAGVGADNAMRRPGFGAVAATARRVAALERDRSHSHPDAAIRDRVTQRQARVA